MKATFGAGCFWHVEHLFASIKGVTSTAVGYTGGHVQNPTYEDVCTDRTGHAEAVQIEYDPDQISYDTLLDVFWANHDPTTLNRQGPDVGVQYRSSIFYHTEDQKESAKKSRKTLQESNNYSKPIVTEIMPAVAFYRAEEYHQKYFEKNHIM